MLGCPGCYVEHADRHLSESRWLGPEENIGLSVCLWKKKTSGLRPGGIRADVGDGMRISRRFLISRGDDIFAVLRSHKKCRIRKCAGREAEVRQIGREKAEFLGEVHPKSLQHDARYFPLFCSSFERM